eukprot:gnl/Dysnectes_brevis/4439_a5968_838.p1 GENE.gnl/Dysnectes_brevis/4439_a5968_838~~gnl/Dysnectes_brevis/4439_a5968_838.p1  ORF type:complete len:539 (+),score=175.90 gnl/Dysnectes_brevis/4439_a5968_838:119-1735(+)
MSSDSSNSSNLFDEALEPVRREQTESKESKEETEMEKNSKQVNKFGTESVSRMILTVAIPTIISMTLNAFYNIVDSAFIGRYVGDEGLAALSAYMPIEFLFTFYIPLALGFGLAALISPALGAGKIREANVYFMTFLLTGIAFALIVPIIVGVITEPVIDFIGVSEQTKANALEYGKVIGRWAFIGYLCVAALGPILRVTNQSIIAMWRQIVSSALNICLDLLFMGAFSWGISGAASATVVSQVLVGAWMIVYWCIPTTQSPIHIRLALVKEFKWKRVGQMLGLGLGFYVSRLPSSLTGLFGNIVIARTSDDLDRTTILQALLGLISRVISLITMPCIGMAQGFAPVAGFNLGAKHYQRVREAIRVSAVWILVFGFLLTVVLELFAGPVMSVFTSNPEMIDTGSRLARIAILLCPLSPFEMMGSAILQMEKKIWMSIITQLTRPLVQIPCTFIPLITGNPEHVFLAFVIADGAVGLVGLGVLLSVYRRYGRLAKEKPDASESSGAGSHPEEEMGVQEDVTIDREMGDVLGSARHEVEE